MMARPENYGRGNISFSDQQHGNDRRSSDQHSYICSNTTRSRESTELNNLSFEKGGKEKKWKW
jgi:hypothetical protein